MSSKKLIADIAKMLNEASVAQEELRALRLEVTKMSQLAYILNCMSAYTSGRNPLDKDLAALVPPADDPTIKEGWRSSTEYVRVSLINTRDVLGSRLEAEVRARADHQALDSLVKSLGSATLTGTGEIITPLSVEEVKELMPDMTADTSSENGESSSKGKQRRSRGGKMPKRPWLLT